MPVYIYDVKPFKKKKTFKHNSAKATFLNFIGNILGMAGTLKLLHLSLK